MLTTVVIQKVKTNELIDNIFTVGVKRLRFGPCQPSCCGTSGCVSLTAASTVAVWSFVFHGFDGVSYPWSIFS